MKSNKWSLVIAAFALLPACGDDTVEPQGKQDGATDGTLGKDTPTADLGPELPRFGGPDLGLWDQSSPDLPPDLASPPDEGLPAEAGGLETQAIFDGSIERGAVETGKAPEVQIDVGKLDAALPDVAPDVAGEAAPPPSYACRNDSDCCIVIENCMAMAYLYSKAPGASPPPTLTGPARDAACLACIPPAVQVRCDSGQCVGEKLPSVYSGPLVQNHCGPVALPDAGAVLFYPPAYAGAQQTSWSCGW